MRFSIDSIGAAAPLQGMEEENLIGWFEEFTICQDPSVVMRMPGCHDVFVNPKHKEMFPDSSVRVASSEEVALLLDSPVPERCLATGEYDVSLLCYCEKGKSILALLSDPYCVFEVAFKHLRGRPRQWEKGIGFLQSETHNECRSYRVYTIHSRVLPGNHKDRYLEARLIPLGDMTIEVRTSAVDSKCVLPRRLKCRATLGHLEWLPEEEYEVPDEEGYSKFGEALYEAKRRLASGLSSSEEAKQYVLEAVRGIRDRYEPIENFTCCLFSHPDPSEVMKKIDEVLSKLSDALVVITKVKQKIRAKLDREISVSTSGQLSLLMQLQLFRGTMKAEDVRLADPAVALLSQKRSQHKPQGEAVPPAGMPQGTDSSSRKGRIMDSPKQSGNFLENLQREADAFEKMLPQLLKTDPGIFVAIHGGEIVDRDKDCRAIMRRVTEKYRQDCVLVEQVEKKSPQLEVIDTLDN